MCLPDSRLITEVALDIWASSKDKGLFKCRNKWESRNENSSHTEFHWHIYLSVFVLSLMCIMENSVGNLNLNLNLDRESRRMRAWFTVLTSLKPQCFTIAGFILRVDLFNDVGLILCIWFAIIDGTSLEETAVCDVATGIESIRESRVGQRLQ